VPEWPIWSFAPFEPTRGVAAFFAEKRLAGHTEAKLSGAGALEIDAWAATADGEVQPSGPEEGTTILPTIPGAVKRHGPWFACVSGATTRLPSTHFHHDLQNHISVWHARLGLIVGGGNSLHDPRFSTFRFHGSYLADAGETRVTPEALGLLLRYGAVTAMTEISFLDDRSVRFRAQADGELPPDSDFAVHLYGRFGERFVLHREDRKLGDGWGFWMGFEPDHELRIGPLRIRCDAVCRVMWPCLPVNIYDPPMPLPIEHAVCRVSANLCDGPITLTLQLEDAPP